MKKIVIVNPGATSTKIAYFEDTDLVWKDEVIYTPDQLKDYAKIYDQFEIRYQDIQVLLENHGISQDLDAVVGRGGLIGPVKAGAIKVDAELIDHLKNHPVLEHASNLGAGLAAAIRDHFGNESCQALIYDPVTVDSMMPIARYTGLKEIQRKSIGHHLNMRAVARRLASDNGLDYDKANLIIVHIGGGATASAHTQGDIVDFVSDDEIMFSAERSGGLPVKEVLKLAKELGVQELSKKVRAEAGLQSLCGTKDLREIEDRVKQGDQEADEVIQAFALQLAKCIATLAVSLKGKVDYIALTGGMAHYDYLCQLIEERVNFIAPFKIYAGEFEAIALAKGGFRVITGIEKASSLEEAMKK